MRHVPYKLASWQAGKLAARPLVVYGTAALRHFAPGVLLISATSFVYQCIAAAAIATRAKMQVRSRGGCAGGIAGETEKY
jgi:hypothetical protein